MDRGALISCDAFRTFPLNCYAFSFLYFFFKNVMAWRNVVHRYQNMPTECATNPLQRALADAIIMMQPLDEIRILLACGAKVRTFSNFKKTKINATFALFYPE